MKPMRRLRRLWPLVLLASIAGAQAAEEFSFDASAFEKKPFELGGYVELKQEDFALNRAGAFYKLNNFGQPQRDDLGRTTGTLQLAGKLRQGMGTFDFRTNSGLQRDQLAHDHDNTIFEAAYSIRSSPGLTMEAGKRALKWGKGYAWNPIGFVERLKDPNDPELSREGFAVLGGSFTRSFDGPLQTVTFTPLLVPTILPRSSSSDVVGSFIAADSRATNSVGPQARRSSSTSMSLRSVRSHSALAERSCSAGMTMIGSAMFTVCSPPARRSACT